MEIANFFLGVDGVVSSNNSSHGSHLRRSESSENHMTLGLFNFKHSNNERGATMVESAIALPLLLVLLIVTFDLLRISYNMLTLQYVSALVMRGAVIGDTSGADIQSNLITSAGRFGVNVKAENISLCPIDRIPCIGVQPGGAQELMVLDVLVPTNGFILRPTAIGVEASIFNLSATVVGRMEPTL